MSIGKHFFMHKHGPKETREAHLDAAASMIPNEGPDLSGKHDIEEMRDAIKADPHYKKYNATYVATKSNRDVMVRMSSSPNHFVRGLAALSIKYHVNAHDPEAMSVTKKVAEKLATDPNAFVRYQVIKHSPGMLSYKTVSRMAVRDSEPKIRDKAANNARERRMFSNGTLGDWGD